MADAQRLFERDPLVGMLSIVVAGNYSPGSRDIDVDGKTIRLPDWDAADWAWWLRTCVGMSRAMEDAKPENASAMPEDLADAYREATGMLTSDGGLRQDLAESIAGDEIGWLRFVVPILMAGGRLVGRQAARATKWAAPYAKKAALASWGVVTKAIKTVPGKAAVGIAIIAAVPDKAVQVVKTAGKMAGALFRGVAEGAGLPGALVIIGLAVAAYYWLDD